MVCYLSLLDIVSEHEHQRQRQQQPHDIEQDHPASNISIFIFPISITSIGLPVVEGILSHARKMVAFEQKP